MNLCSYARTLLLRLKNLLKLWRRMHNVAVAFMKSPPQGSDLNGMGLIFLPLTPSIFGGHHGLVVKGLQ